MTQPTADQIALALLMARRIAANVLCREKAWNGGVKAGMYRDIIDGKADDEAIVQIALAAIIETTAETVDWLRSGYHDFADVHATEVADAIERGHHLAKGPQSDD